MISYYASLHQIPVQQHFVFFQLVVIYNSSNKSFIQSVYIASIYIENTKLAPKWCSSITVYSNVGNNYSEVCQITFNVFTIYK